MFQQSRPAAACGAVFAVVLFLAAGDGGYSPGREVLATLKKRPGATFGFGLALWLLLWLPVVNCFLMPLAVVAGTLLYREAA